MKTFKITKNSQYIQSIQLDKGTYTYSCNVKSDATVLTIAFQNEKGVWTDFEIPILSGMWNKKAKLTFDLKEKMVNFDLCKYASDENRVYVQAPMLEEGTNDSTPKPSDLDDLEEIDNNKSQIKAFNLAFEDLENYIDGAFKDGVIDSAEATTIAQLIKTVESERDKMLATYDKLFLNSYLEGTAKTSLQQNKITFVGAVNDVITAINTAIADNKITPTERTNVNNKFNAYKTALADFSTSIENANKAIQDKLKGYSDNAQSSADQAQQKANQAQSDATNANAKLADIASDSKITPSEKQETKKEWDVIEAEFWLNLAQAGNAGVDTENYSDSFVNLQDYIPPLLSDLNATSDINGEQFRQVFVDYYTARTDLLNDIAIKIKGIADDAQNKANQAQADANVAKAKTQYMTEIDGGIIYSGMMKLHDAGTTNAESAGSSGIVNNNPRNPAFYAGGTYAEAIAGLAKAIIRHDGSVKFTDGEFVGKISATSGKIGVLNVSTDGVVSTDDFIVDKDGKVYMQGATMEGQILPFSTLKENFSKNTYSIVWDSVTPGFNGNINLPTPVSDTHKRGGMSYVIVNLHPNNGVLTVNATGGYKIYDIIKSPASSITINKGSYVEIIGVGSENGFYGWFIKLNSPYNLG